MSLLFSLILSFLVIRGFRFEFGVKVLVTRNTESFLWLLLFLFFVWFFRRFLRRGEIRLKIYAGITGAVIALYHVTGSSLEHMTNVSWIFENGKMFLNFLNMLFSFVCLYTAFVFLLFRVPESLADGEAEKDRRGSFSRQVLLVWLIFLLCYLPWYLYFYPGILTYDSGGQIEDALSTGSVSDHNPAFVTLLIRAVMLPVIRITGSNLTAVGVCTFLQMLVMTFIFALSYVRIRAYVRHFLLRSPVFIWFAFYPVNNIYSFTMWKDILFSGCLLCFLLCVDDCAENEDAFFGSKKRCLLMFLTMLLLPLLRHNGIAVTGGMSIYFLFRFRKYRKKAALICCGALLCFGLWKAVLLPMMHAGKNISAELLNVPIQQIARVFSGHHHEIPPRLAEDLSEYFTEPEFWTEYWEKIADPVKVLFNVSVYEENPSRFFSLWAQLGKQYPLEYLDAWLQNNYGYWFPETTWWITGRGVIINVPIEGLEQAPILRIGVIDRIYDWYINAEYMKTPLLPLFFKPGAVWWLWVLCGMYCLYRNRGKFVLFLPGLLLWLTLQWSAVYCEFRYAYGLVICLPLLMAASFSRPAAQTPREDLSSIPDR